MRPAVTILQLDTHFPRVPGDVGCAATYRDDVEIMRIPGASVGQVVSAAPERIPMVPFEMAMDRAQGEVIVTSCGFLAYWQAHLATRTDRPFISSSLTALSALCVQHEAREIVTLTFDVDRLNTAHFGPYQTDVIGLPKGMHLRRVISENQTQLDTKRVEVELSDYLASAVKPHHKHLLLECTNLPPYKAALRRATGLPITDILTCIEGARPGTIQPEFL